MGKKLIRFDWEMKTLLRNKANFDVLEGFLSALLEDDNITILNILESETNPDDETDKFNRVDLLVEDSQKRKIFIEIQNTRETDDLESLLFGTSKIIVENQDLGKDFRDISKVISISILYFNWIYMIKNNEVAEGSTSKNIDKARQKLATMNMTDDEKKRYEKYLINLIRNKDVINTAKEEGWDQGRIEGLLESEIKGKLEGKLEVAKALKQNDIAIEIIIKATGLTTAQISEL